GPVNHRLPLRNDGWCGFAAILSNVVSFSPADCPSPKSSRLGVWFGCSRKAQDGPGPELKERKQTMSDPKPEAALDTGVKNRKPSLVAYQVREGKDEQNYWDRIGVAWSNRDGGFTVQLHSIPLDGRIVLTKPKSNS